MDDSFNQALAAVSEDCLEDLRALVREHPEVLDARDPADGGTLLHSAVWARSLGCCQVLVEAGADPCAIRTEQYHPEHRHSGSGSQTPLALALEVNRPEIAAYLQTVRIVSDNLWMAASLGDLERVKQFFCADGALTPDAADPGKRGTVQDALDDACVGAAHQRKNEVAIYLLDRGADPSGRDHFGMTALHYAVQGNLPLVEVLISRGVSPRVRDFQFDATPVGWARYQGHTDTLAYLLKHADVDPADSNH